MRSERTTTIAVNVDDLQRLAYWASMGILDESEGDDLNHLTADEGRDYRADLGRWLAMAFIHGNMAADAQDDGTRTPRTDILEALSGKLTSRRLAA